jgi:hypothetical protein
MEIVFEMSLDFDFLTRSAVLKRVNEIFAGVIDTKRKNEEVVDEILDEYFADTSEQIKNGILFKKQEEKRESCCTSCHIL